MTNEPSEDQFFEEILKSTVIAVKCNNCNSDQIMNTAYMKYVPNGLMACSNCRNSNR